MTKKVKILGRRAIPLWLLVFALVAAGAGAAAGTVLAGQVPGDVNVAVSQALLTEKPQWLSADNITSKSLTTATATQQVFHHQGMIALPKRSFGAAKDDNTAFQAAAELATGDWAAFDLPLKNASNNNLNGLVTLNVPAGLEVEVFAASGAVNISQVVRVGLNTWKFNLLPTTSDYSSASYLTVVVSTDDDMAPGYYTIDGSIQQIAY